MQGRSTIWRVLPLEKEWERERLSCSLFAGTDENKEQIIWDGWYEWTRTFKVDTLRLTFLVCTLWFYGMTGDAHLYNGREAKGCGLHWRLGKYVTRVSCGVAIGNRVVGEKPVTKHGEGIDVHPLVVSEALAHTQHSEEISWHGAIQLCYRQRLK